MTNAKEKTKKTAQAVKEPKIAEKVEPKKAKEKSEKKPAEVKVSKKLGDLISQVEQLSVLELSDLVKALEEKFGVSGVPMAPVAGGPTTNGDTATDGAKDEGASEQTTFNVILASPGANKISVIKMVREINQTLGLKEAKDLVESAPKEILNAVNKSTAEEAKKKLEGVGASVELK